MDSNATNKQQQQQLITGRTNSSGNAVVSGVVRTTTGAPVHGAMVIGCDLNYTETDANGYFELKNPDDAIVFWCTGFTPKTRLVPPGTAAGMMDVVLQAL